MPDAWDCTLITRAKQNADLLCNPIYEWEDRDIWEYLQTYKIRTNPLYDCGYTRVGCIGCPLAGRRDKERGFADFPKYKDAYIRAFDRMVDAREADGKENRGTWKDGKAVFRWWVEDRNIEGQLKFDENGIIREE